MIYSQNIFVRDHDKSKLLLLRKQSWPSTSNTPAPKPLLMRFFLIGCCAWLLTGCASQPLPKAGGAKEDSFALPAEVSFNHDAGRGNLLVVNVQLADGTQLPFVVDSGAGATCFDTSLVSKLGKSVGTVKVNQWGEHPRKKVYALPKLYLGGVQLHSGSSVVAMDFKSLSMLFEQPILGVLGMDVLEHYCVQMDFAAGKLRFLDDAQADKSAWGRAFPIVPLNDKDTRPAVAGNLFGEEGPRSLIDSGYEVEGWLMPQHYRQWTNQVTVPAAGKARSPDGRFAGETYPEVTLRVEKVESDGIGLAFLARHLVTMDFPNHTLYLKRTSTGPLPSAGESALTYLKHLKNQGRLPGWSREEQGAPRDLKKTVADNTVTVEATKSSESSVYHYQLTRASAEAPWKLVKAWRTNARGRMLENYPVP
jgi:hypothetical protein